MISRMKTSKKKKLAFLTSLELGTRYAWIGQIHVPSRLDNTGKLLRTCSLELRR